MNAYQRYLITLLAFILALNYTDRLVLGVVLQNIKVDLGLSDTQLGFLSGIAFALFYSVMGLPIARWADRGNRTAIIALTAAIWSIAVALCGLSRSFMQLLAVRVTVAVGEAGCIPPAHSLLADTFSRPHRARAVALYMLGAPLSVVFGYFIGGWLNQLYGWRLTFILVGAPGVVVTSLAWFTIREPRRKHAGTAVRGRGDELPRQFGTKHVAGVLWRNRTFRRLLSCFSIASFFSYGIVQWQPTFLIRSFALETGELGTWLALIYGVGGILGTYLGGALASRYFANQERLQLRAMAVSYVALGAVSVLLYLCDGRSITLALITVTAVVGALATAPLFALIQSLIPAHMRAVSIATVYLFANLIGMGLGPLAAGALSDALRPEFGDASLRYALMALSPGYVLAGWYLWAGSQSVTTDLARARDEEN